MLTGSFPIRWNPTRWTSPRAWIVGSIGMSERLRVTIAPDLSFRDWQPGGYRLVRAETNPNRGYEIELEPGNVSGEGGQSTPPSLVLTPRIDDAPVIQRSEWSIDPSSQTWIVRTAVRTRGAGSTLLRFRLPDAWDVEDVAVGPQSVPWNVPKKLPRELQVDTTGPPVNPKGDEVVVRLSRRGSVVGRELRLPDLMPVGTRPRSGTLAIRLHHSLQITSSDDVPGKTTPEAPAVKPSRTFLLNAEPLLGNVNVQQLRTFPRTELESELILGMPNTVQCRLKIVPVGGPVSELMLWTPVRLTVPWAWMTEDGRRLADAIEDSGSLTAIQMLGNLPGPSFAIGVAVRSVAAGHWWRIHLPRPLDRPTVLVSVLLSADSSPSFPVPWVVGTPFHGTLIAPPSVDVRRLDQRLRVEDTTSALVKKFRYGTDREQDRPPSVNEGVTNGARLQSVVGPRGDVHAEFRFRVRHWTSGFVAIELPMNASHPAIQVASRPVPVMFSGSKGRSLAIPVPISNEWTTVSVRYRLPASAGVLLCRAISPLPVGPMRAEQVEQYWRRESVLGCRFGRP